MDDATLVTRRVWVVLSALVAASASAAACSLFDPCEAKGSADEQLRRTLGVGLDHAQCADTACIGDVSTADASRLWSAASASMAAADRGATPALCAPMYALADVREQQAAFLGGGSQCTWAYWYLVSASTGRVCASVERDRSFFRSIRNAIHGSSH